MGSWNTSAIGAVREWAKRHGFQVGDRGRLPAAVVDAYQAAAEAADATPVGRPARKVPAIARKAAAVLPVQRRLR